MKWRARWPFMPWENCTPSGPGRRNFDLPAAEPKAVVFYQASLLVCPQNYMSANDLGVVLARERLLCRGPLGPGAQRPHLAAVGQPGQPGGGLSATGAAAVGRAGAAAGRGGPPGRGRAAAGAADFGRRRGAVGRSAHVCRRPSVEAPDPPPAAPRPAGSRTSLSRRPRRQRPAPAGQPRERTDPLVPGPWSGRPLQHLRRRLRRVGCWRLPTAGKPPG